MTVFIGRLFNIGIGKETTRGTAIAAAYWIQKTDFAVEDHISTVIDDASINTIEDAQQQEITQKYSQGTIGGRITDQTFGLMLMATLGTDTLGAVETGVKDHVFTVLETAQHPSLTLTVNEPNATGASSLLYPLGMIDSLNIHFEVGKWATYKMAFTANAPSNASSTVAFVTENGFNPQYCTLQMAPTYTGLIGGITATGTAASTVNVTALSISTTLLQVGMTVTATNLPAGATIVAIVSANAFTLSVATTGAIGTMTFGAAVLNARMVDITIQKNIEDDLTIGSLAAADRFNKQFVITGSFTIVYKDRSYIDTIMYGDQNKALRFIAKNTGITIGTVSNPTLTFDLALTNLQEVARSDKNSDIMLQTVKFKAFYSVTDSLMTKITLRNTVTTAY